MATSKEQELIIEYWVRTVLNLTIAINDIIKIMIEFADEFETFDPLLIHEKITTNSDYMSISHHPEHSQLSAFGKVIACPRRKYHWKLVIIDRYTSANIGVIESDKCKEWISKFWWNNPFGFSYYHTGSVFSGTDEGMKSDIEFGEEFKKGDIIHIYLDLKDNYDIGWGRNAKQFQKAFNVNKDTDYRLAVSLNSGTVDLISLEIEN